MSAAPIERDQMEYDVVIVGAGPAGLACAIRLKQLKPDLSVCVLEKASAVGAHSLSGAVLEPGPLEALLPEWRSEYPGMKVPAREDEFRILTRGGSFKPVPDFLVRLLPRSLTYSTPFTVLAEGARGSISKQLIAKFDLARGHCPQTFALGYKELWQLPAGRVRP